MSRIGEIAGILTSLLWVGSSLSFSAAGRHTSVTTINVVRCLLAVFGLWVVFAIDRGEVLPQLLTRDVILLAASGVVGLAIGDQCLFTAFVTIGPRRSMLIMTTVPILAAGLAIPTTGEVIEPIELFGMAVTLAGVAWVITERTSAGQVYLDPRDRRRGITCALLAAFCQALGMVFAKLCWHHRAALGLPPLDELPALLVRMAAGTLGTLAIAAIIVARGRVRVRQGLLRAFPFIAAGALAGPTLGVYCSLVAVHHASTGVATTLMSLTPVFILPFAAFVEKEKPSIRAILGAIIAVAGVAILALIGSSDTVTP